MFLIFYPFLPLHVLTSEVAVVKSCHGISVKYSRYRDTGTTDPSLPLVHQSPGIHSQGSRCCRPLFCASNWSARTSEHLGLTRSPHLHPEELVVSIHQGQEYYRVEALVVVVEAASPLWRYYWNMLSIQDTQGMRNVLSPVEDGLDLQPVLWECGALHHLVSIGPDDSVTDLRHKLVDGQTGHPEGILQGGVAVSSGQISEGDCQLESWTPGLSHPGPLPLLELLKELEWNPHEVTVCHRVI